MNQYSEELKASLIARMLPPNNVSVAELVRETGIPKDTLYTWRRNAQKGHAPAQEKPADGLSSEEKFNVVLETASLNEVELGEYCRRKGLFPQQIDAWREICKQAHAPLAPKADRQKLRNQAKEIKSLDAELRRKEKALAEAAALLVLQKKVRALWEEPEEQRSALRSVEQ
jgi:transposase-like protein